MIFTSPFPLLIIILSAIEWFTVGLIGQAQYLGIHKRWQDVAEVVGQLIISEQHLIDALG